MRLIQNGTFHLSHHVLSVSVVHFGTGDVVRVRGYSGLLYMGAKIGPLFIGWELFSGLSRLFVGPKIICSYQFVALGW